MQEALDRLFSPLPRQGPGNDDATRFAVEQLPPLRDNAVIYDLGCGSGAQTLVLADKLQKQITAVDVVRPFLEQLKNRADGRNAADLIKIVRADINDLDWQDGSVDLIWCEGAVYNFGFANALKAWKSKLRLGGCIALTECCWLTRTPPKPAARFWAEAYPSMQSKARNIAAAKAAGYKVISSFELPGDAWWTDYYTPLIARIEDLKDGADKKLLDLISGLESEIELRRKHGDAYGYVFFILQKPG